jgi:hypothetical protein
MIHLFDGVAVTGTSSQFGERALRGIHTGIAQAVGAVGGRRAQPFADLDLGLGATWNPTG